jgi:hypothetical protein
MQTTHLPILRCSALSAPFAVLGSAVFGPGAVAAAAVSSLVVLVNLWVLAVLGPRLVGSLAANDGEGDGTAGLWAAALCGKFVLILAVFVGLVQVLPPVGLAMGFLSIPAGTVVAALLPARSDSGDRPAGTLPEEA